MRFNQTTACYWGLFGVLAVGWVAMMVCTNANDLRKVERLIRKEKAAHAKTAFHTTDQQRKEVVKEIWFTQEDNTRLHYQIASHSSLLTIQPDGNRFDLIEKLQHLNCWMQDKVDEGGQQVRYLQADEGLYRFTSQQFLAQSVALSLYRLPGSDLPVVKPQLPPFLQGIAEDVSFAVSGKNPQFQAQHFKAELTNVGERR